MTSQNHGGIEGVSNERKRPEDMVRTPNPSWWGWVNVE